VRIDEIQGKSTHDTSQHDSSGAGHSAYQLLPRATGCANHREQPALAILGFSELNQQLNTFILPAANRCLWQAINKTKTASVGARRAGFNEFQQRLSI
jgi:hypothetical protein